MNLYLVVKTITYPYSHAATLRHIQAQLLR